MKKYRFVGKPIEYGNITVIKLIPNMIYNSDQKLYTGEKFTVGYYAPMYPEDWEEVIDKDVERQEILDAVNKPLKALRYNNGKPAYSLLDLNALEPGVKVLEFGAVKYARDNWQKGFPFSTILDSMMRHIAALQRGEWIDPESGLPHIGHIQCNAMFLGGKNNIMDIEALKQESNFCCGNWDNEGQCKCIDKSRAEYGVYS